MRRHLSLLAVLLIAACADDENNPVVPEPQACSVTLSPGADDQTTVQAALIAGRTGDLICLSAGTFTFTDELSLSVSGVTIRGAGRDQTILDFSAQATGGNALKVTGGDFIVESLTIKDPKGDGVRTEGVSNVTFRDIRVYWSGGGLPTNGAYGVYPVDCVNVLVENIEVSGAADAAIYVGQSRNIVVRNSLAFGSVAGIEIENSTDAEVTGNTVRDNAAGILMLEIPGLPVERGTRIKVHANTVMNNNTENFAVSGLVAGVPSGTGIMILASDRVEVHGNTISGNESVGLMIVSCDALDVVFPGLLACDDPGYDGNPDAAYVHDNSFSGNGTAPHDFFADPPFSFTTGPTIFYDGFEVVTDQTKLCIQEAAGTTFFNFANQADTLALHDCAYTSLPSIQVTWGTSP